MQWEVFVVVQLCFTARLHDNPRHAVNPRNTFFSRLQLEQFDALITDSFQGMLLLGRHEPRIQKLNLSGKGLLTNSTIPTSHPYCNQSRLCFAIGLPPFLV